MSREPVHAVFPGTFDPVTFGHLDVLARARSLFAKVTLAVATHHEKQQVFDLDERLALLRACVDDEVEAVALEGLLVDGCRKLGARVVVRGVRSAGDLDYERQMALTNRALAPELETVFLLPAPEHSNVSSTLVRQIARMGGDVSPFVPPPVAAALAARFPRQP